MFKWSNCFYINPEDVSVISTGASGSNTHPHCMAVQLRSGKEYRVSYSTASARDADAQRLAQAVNKLQPEPASRYEIEHLIDRAKDTIRREIRALRKELQAKNEG